MPKGRIIRIPQEANRATAKSVKSFVVPGKKKSSPSTIKANNPKG